MRLSGLLVAASLFVAGTAHAAVVFDDMTGNTHASSGVWVGYDSGFNETATAGIQFHNSQTGYIDSITALVSGSTSGNVAIYTDNNNQIGSLVETLAITESSNPFVPATGNYASGVTLTAGETYWAVVGGPSLQNWLNENVASNNYREFLQIVSGNVTFTPPGASFNYRQVSNNLAYGLKIDIAPTSVPEPGAGLLLVSAIVSLLGLLGSAQAWRTPFRAMHM